MVYINDKHRFIFLENPKSASCTIRAALNCALGLSEYRYKNIRTTHSTSSEVRKQVGEERWNSYFKFTTYRDPYKRFQDIIN